MTDSPAPCWVVPWYDAKRDKWSLSEWAEKAAAHEFAARCDRDGTPHKAPFPYPAAGIARSVGAAAVGDIDDIDPVHTSKTATPTETLYRALQLAFAYFNHHLFDDLLSSVMFTLQRRSHTYGYYSPRKFGELSDSTTRIDEIALNPAHFRSRSVRDICATLVHEMVHMAEEHAGTASRGRYHNRSWAAHMKRVGLYPSSTGQPGGKETGASVSHYIMPNGRFDQAFALFNPEITWGDVTAETEAPPRPKRVKIVCPVCDFGLQAVASAVGVLACIPCGNVPMVAAG